ncbi:hypothetical protein CBR_g29517 [Chara braunii]|uniref:Pectate lyase domain-containing protein n=1 Tax=Chara braunii TaxID=69332 RepID=A0A388LAM5_CHABU|nr:hypothetical protein CBR_g29517 [Chara braunii]|eukprot:GBG79369.1 hypothetical protein CBR_g29517 [Chara braunii]
MESFTNGSRRSSTLYSLLLLLLVVAPAAFATSLTSTADGLGPSSHVAGANGHRKLGDVRPEVSPFADADGTGVAEQPARKMQEAGGSLAEALDESGKGSGGGGGYFGFGGQTTGGAGGPTVYVDNCNDSGPGSLRYWCGLPGKRVIKFKQDCTLRLKSRLECTNDKTVDGSGQQVKITGWGVSANRVSNVIFKSLCITGTRLDGVTVRLSSNIVVQGCTISKVGDGGMDVITKSTGISILNNHFTGDLKAILVGNSDGASADAATRVTVAFNFFDNCGSRLPRVRWATVHVCSNLYVRWGHYAIGASRKARLLVEKSIFEPGENLYVNNLHEGEKDGTIIEYRGNTLNGAKLLPTHLGTVDMPFSCPAWSEDSIRSGAGVNYPCV